MFEEMMENLREELRHDIATFVNYGVKSPMLQRCQRALKLDNEDFLKDCKAIR